MSEGLADTTIFIARESGRALRWDLLPERIGVSVITVGELRAGVLAAADLETRDRRLATLTAVLALAPVPVDEDVAAAWAHLRVALLDIGRRMGVNDSWIAATAIALDVPLVTRDDGYADVPSLRVIRV